jgi:hypothetical protein
MLLNRCIIGGDMQDKHGLVIKDIGVQNDTKVPEWMPRKGRILSYKYAAGERWFMGSS